MMFYNVTLDVSAINEQNFHITVTTIFMRESSYCFQRFLAITILSVRLSVCHTGGSIKNGAS